MTQRGAKQGAVKLAVLAHAEAHPAASYADVARAFPGTAPNSVRRIMIDAGFTRPVQLPDIELTRKQREWVMASAGRLGIPGSEVLKLCVIAAMKNDLFGER